MSNLYIINQVLSDYTAGMAVIAAPDLNRCRELFSELVGGSRFAMEEYDQAIQDGDFKVLQVQDQQEGVVSYVYGGS